MLVTGPVASRRAVLVAGAVAVSAGCDLDPRSSPAPAAAPTSGAPADPSVEADLVLLHEVRIQVAAMDDAVALARREQRDLRTALHPLQRMHREHLGVLDDVGPSPSAAAGTPGVSGQDLALAVVRRAELAHQRFLARSSVEAASGSFARMLASMSAAVAAHLVALPEQS